MGIKFPIDSKVRVIAKGREHLNDLGVVTLKNEMHGYRVAFSNAPHSGWFQENELIAVNVERMQPELRDLIWKYARRCYELGGQRELLFLADAAAFQNPDETNAENARYHQLKVNELETECNRLRDDLTTWGWE